MRFYLSVPVLLAMKNRTLAAIQIGMYAIADAGYGGVLIQASAGNPKMLRFSSPFLLMRLVVILLVSALFAPVVSGHTDSFAWVDSNKQVHLFLNGENRIIGEGSNPLFSDTDTYGNRAVWRDGMSNLYVYDSGEILKLPVRGYHPVIYEDKVFYKWNGELYAYNLTTGKKRALMKSGDILAHSGDLALLKRGYDIEGNAELFFYDLASEKAIKDFAVPSLYPPKPVTNEPGGRGHVTHFLKLYGPDMCVGEKALLSYVKYYNGVEDMRHIPCIYDVDRNEEKELTWLIKEGIGFIASSVYGNNAAYLARIWDGEELTDRFKVIVVDINREEVISEEELRFDGSLIGIRLREGGLYVILDSEVVKMEV